ncbi:MAG: hypothetical protein DI533_14435 [Cereibacter sphaeroides]|uniref:Glycosyltransferase RgtA/B/C/D-like domain-containing protein n=1 Tax=Cereibacter sphaeroides TaxID=1063 RepID=A0A2W5S4W2_CERSP|nr:MAG: hypothetical protein DI533_14435 [Cereibacter sphaeroides]
MIVQMRRLADRSGFWLTLFAIYAIAQSAIRVYYKSSFFGDDSELFLWARELAWGYGVQPPLYAWLQWFVNRIFGEGQVGMAAMRALCIWGIYGAGFLLARRFVAVRHAGLAALGLFLIPEISQTFLRTRTHNLLVTALVPLACIAFLDLLSRRRARDYLGFGLMAGLAVIAKATGAIFLVALVISAAILRETRPAIAAKGMWLSLLAVLVVVAGPTLWSLANPEIATASLAKFEPGGGWPTGLARLGWSVIASAGFAAVAIAIGWVLTRRTEEPPPRLGLFWLAGILSLALIAITIIATNSAELKERWLVPVVAPLVPLAIAALLRRRGIARFTPSALGALAGALMLATLPAYFQKTEPLPRADFALLADVFARTGADRMLMTDDMAAGLALAQPDIPVEQRVDRGALACRGKLLLAIWPEEDFALEAFAARLPGCDLVDGREQAIDAGGIQVRYRVFTLTPSAG